jgi:hypothetical protein
VEEEVKMAEPPTGLESEVDEGLDYDSDFNIHQAQGEPGPSALQKFLKTLKETDEDEAIKNSAKILEALSIGPGEEIGRSGRLSHLSPKIASPRGINVKNPSSMPYHVLDVKDLTAEVQKLTQGLLHPDSLIRSHNIKYLV